MKLERNSEEIFVELHANLGYLEHLLKNILLNIFKQACSHEDSHRRFGLIFVFQHLIWTSNKTKKIS